MFCDAGINCKCCDADAGCDADGLQATCSQEGGGRGLVIPNKITTLQKLWRICACEYFLAVKVHILIIYWFNALQCNWMNMVCFCPLLSLVLTCDGFLKFLWELPPIRGRNGKIESCRVPCKHMRINYHLSCCCLSWLGSMSSHFLVIFDQIKVRTCPGFFATAGSMKYPWIKLLAKNDPWMRRPLQMKVLPIIMASIATNGPMKHKLLQFAPIEDIE